MSTPPEPGDHVVDRRLNGLLVADVDLDGDGLIAGPQRPGHGAGRLDVDVGDDDGGALLAESHGDGPTDPGARAGHERDLAGERLGPRAALELALLQHPVLDAELLGLGDRRVRRQGLGSADRVDRGHVELPGDAGGLAVGAEAEHADSGNQEDGGSAPRIGGVSAPAYRS
jgi:hypothetical protein